MSYSKEFKYSKEFIHKILLKMNLPIPKPIEKIPNKNSKKRKYSKPVFIRYLRIKKIHANKATQMIHEYQKKEKKKKIKVNKLQNFISTQAHVDKDKLKQIPSDNLLDWYLNKIKEYPILSIEEQDKLFRQTKIGSDIDREKSKTLLIYTNLLFVVKISKKYSNSSVDLLDLINEGNLGLLHSIKKFNPDFNIPFPGYAIYWIELYIRTAIKKHGNLIRLPIGKIDMLSKINRVAKEMTNNQGKKPTNEELSSYLNIPIQKVNTLMDLKNLMNFSEAPLFTLSPTSKKEHTENILSNLFLKEYLNQKLDILSKANKQLIELRFGLNDVQLLSVEEIAQKLKKTKSFVIINLEKALHLLFHELKKDKANDYL